MKLKIKIMPRAKDKWVIYKDNAGKYRWRRTAPNGDVVGASTQGYVNRGDCIANAKRNGMRI